MHTKYGIIIYSIWLGYKPWGPRAICLTILSIPHADLVGLIVYVLQPLIYLLIKSQIASDPSWWPFCNLCFLTFFVKLYDILFHTITIDSVNVFMEWNDDESIEQQHEYWVKLVK